MPDLIDPLADLKAEIAAEEAGAPQPDETAAEEAKLAEEEAKVAAEEAAAEPVAEPAPEEAPKKRKAKTPPEERMVPAERLTEYAVRVRMLEKEKEELEKKLNPPPPQAPKPPRSEDQIIAQARAQARLEIQLETFATEGNTKYGQAAFDAACDKVAKLIGGPTDLVAVAIEVTGSPKDASTAIMTLGSMEAPDITAFLQLSRLRQAAQLARWATPARRRAAATEDEPAPRRRRQVEVEEDEELEPIRPLQGANAVSESLGDDVPMDLWVKRFDEQVLNKKPH